MLGRRGALQLLAGAAVYALTVPRIMRGEESVRRLRLYTWTDYFAPALIAAFEGAESCKVEIETFSSNEELFANLDSGQFKYDLLTPSSYMASSLHRMKKLQPLDLKRIPNAKNLEQQYLATCADERMEYSVPFEFSVSGIGFVPEHYKPESNAWTSFQSVKVARRYTLLDDMREVIGAALKSIGKSVNSREPVELEAAKKVAAEWLKGSRRFDSDTYRFNLIAGEDLIAHGYSGDFIADKVRNNKLGFFIPEEGAPMACDDFCVPADCSNAELSHKFIDYFCNPKVAAENMKWSGFRAPVTGARDLLPVQLRSNEVLFPSKEHLARCEVLRDVGDALKHLEKIWIELLNG